MQSLYKSQNKFLYNNQEEHDACGVGFVGSLDNKPEHKIVEYALTSMAHLTHRGGREDDEKMSDGSGILMPIPLAFFGKFFPEMFDNSLSWGLGSFFLPIETFLYESLMEIIEQTATKFSFRIASTRAVPNDINVLSRKTLSSLPEFLQILFVSTKKSGQNAKCNDIEQELYVLRKQIEFEAIEFLQKQQRELSLFHCVSLSSRSIIYKGILPGKNLGLFYSDLRESDFAVPFAVFHERFSTNTKPSWHLTQPFRNIAHNGEINTIRGNKIQMDIREASMQSEKLGEDLKYVLPCIHPSTSDSGSFDNVFELLMQGGYNLEHAITTLIPEPIFKNDEQNAKRNAFYSYHMPLMEPWDGPTTMVFTDGYSKVGASLDRNGLRPCRYSITKDNIIIMASEVGVLNISQDEYVSHGQLAPRSLFIVDFEKGKILSDSEVKEELFSQNDYAKVLEKTKIKLSSFEEAVKNEEKAYKAENFTNFGFNDKYPESTLVSMIHAQEEPVGAMGLDEPLAVLSSKPQTLFNYFKQLFAQVTNPSIDPIREKMSMSLSSTLGGTPNIFQKASQSPSYIYLDTPFLFASQMQEIESKKELPSERLSITMPLEADYASFCKCIENLVQKAEKAVKSGKRILILSDKDMAKNKIPLPAMLAIGAVHQDLIRKKLRHLCGIILETGQACEVMDMALLLSFGANAIYPFGAFSSITNYVNNGKIQKEFDIKNSISRYSKALEKGLLKVFGRLGISTLQSFAGSQCFEAIGVHADVIEKYFRGTYSRIGGIQLEDIYKENKERVTNCINETRELSKSDKHIWSKKTCSLMRNSVVENNFILFKEYTKELNEKMQNITLRSVWKQKTSKPIALNKVESIEEIRKRFFGAAMSLGALSKESHECIAEGFNALGLQTNSGEGGEEISRSRSKNADKDLCSRIRQIASGRFGVTAEYLASGDEVQIKVAQGAKPGEGGQLPAHKVTEYIAKVRHTQANVSLISPPPHHDIYSIEDLAQLIYDIKKLRAGIKVSVKLVAQAGIGTVAVGVVKAGADTICISGHDGGTGAAPLSSIYHVGLPWELGLAEVHQALLANAMRYKVTLQTDGQIHSANDVVTAFMLGADEVVFGTSLLIAMGCVLCKQCYKGRCPAGICTQEADLIKRFAGTAEHIQNFVNHIAEETRELLAKLGFSHVQELIGRSDLLELNKEILPQKANDLDMSLLFNDLPYTKRLTSATLAEMAEWEEKLYFEMQDNIQRNIPSDYYHTIKNTDRAVGTNIAGAMALASKQSGREFDEDFIQLHCTGTAGQSFGAFAPKGLSLNLYGSANDYIGKGLCGGKIAISPHSSYPNAKTNSELQKQSIIGNVALYGATSGKAFICGKAGERFAVRNSGAKAVVEGIGEHGCEYMTGGIIVVLGTCGQNFAAGMTGGSVYVHDPKKQLELTCNSSSVDIDLISNDDKIAIKALLDEHVLYTQSNYAKHLLSNWENMAKEFVKVVPHEAKKYLENK